MALFKSRLLALYFLFRDAKVEIKFVITKKNLENFYVFPYYLCFFSLKLVKK